jgi:hypothetical protein
MFSWWHRDIIAAGKLPLMLARPNSIWARRRYRGERLEHATRRAADFDRRWKPLLVDWEDFIGGRPSLPNPPVPPPLPPSPHHAAQRPGDDQAAR